MGLGAPSPVVAWKILREKGQRVSLAGEKRGIVYYAGFYMNCGDSLGARNGDTAVTGLLQHMAADRKPTTSKSPGIRSRAKGTAEGAGARAIQGRGVAKSE